MFIETLPEATQRSLELLGAKKTPAHFIWQVVRRLRFTWGIAFQLTLIFSRPSRFLLQIWGNALVK